MPQSGKEKGNGAVTPERKRGERNEGRMLGREQVEIGQEEEGELTLHCLRIGRG